MDTGDKKEEVQGEENIEKEEESPIQLHPNAINDEDDHSYDESSSDGDDNDGYNHMLHPNEENASASVAMGQSKKKSGHEKRKYKGCSRYVHRFDELIMKPIFIYNYERNM